ncbi:Hypothetical predicted protein [Lecanosticta acicola]|uniref:Uncharacterized protein n=1 Tax=Lecanosticta acicola TaxID=111012 RepID=A0AAI8YYY5_9PEZI|nr:Hypothetical predicted protein [Lecanosticta acicola]
MTSATATATMAAAAGFDKRASTASSLQTPGSGAFPSEMCSPLAASPSFPKRDDLKTPITPPSAYLDFLKNYSPDIRSPVSTGTSAKFSFGEKSFDKSSDKASDASGHRSTSNGPTTSQPSLSRNTSYDSNYSNTTEQSSISSIGSGVSTGTSRPESPRIIVPSSQSQFVRPGPRSARTPRRLKIPQSPFSPAIGSAQTAPSPYLSTPLSAAPWSASFSPRDHTSFDATSQPGKVHVRHVVTRTVRYCRTPLDPAPKGKRRKIEETSEPSSKASSEEPPIKQERIEKIDQETETEPVTAAAAAAAAAECQATV